MDMGQEVTVESSRGPVSRVVVADLGEVVTVCTKEEFYRARAEGREPVAVGFPKSDITAFA